MSENQSEIGIGLLGYGETGRRHARAWRAMAFQEGLPPIRLVTVVDPDTDAADRAMSEAAFDFISDGLEELIAHPAVHVVDICTPATEHADALRSAMAAGKHICVSPPLTYTLRDAEEIAALAGRTPGVKYMASAWRSLPALELARDLIEAGFLGEPRRVMLRNVRAAAPDGVESVPSPNMDFPTSVLLPDALGLLRMLAGEIGEVSASFIAFPNGAVDGEIESAGITAMLRFVSGAMGILQAATVDNEALEEMEVEVAGSAGEIRFNLGAPDTLHIFDATADRGVSGWKALRAPCEHDGEMAALRRFIEAIGTDTPRHPSFRDGLMVHRVVDAMRLSANAGGWEPVDLGR